MCSLFPLKKYDVNSLLGILCVFSFSSVLQASYLDNWTKINPVAYNGIIHDTAFANGHFYLLGERGEITRSEDAVYWNTVLKPQYQWELNALVASEAMMVAVGTEGTVAVSTDGLHWDSLHLQPENSEMDEEITFVDIAYGAGDYVAVGYVKGRYATYPGRAIAFSSTDGSNWSEIPIGGETQFFSVAYGADCFVVTGEDGVYRSDGETWSYQEISDVSQYEKYVEFSEGIFYLREESVWGSRYEDPSVPLVIDHYSTDGIHWNETIPNRMRMLSANDRWWFYFREASYGGAFPSYMMSLQRLTEGWYEGSDRKTDLSVFKRYHVYDSFAHPTKLVFGNDLYLLVGRSTLAYFSADDSGMTDPRIESPSLDVYDMAVFQNRLWYVGRERWGFSEDGFNWVENDWGHSGWEYPRGVDAIDDILMFRNSDYIVLQKDDLQTWHPTFLFSETRSEYLQGPMVHFGDQYLIFKLFGNTYLEADDGIHWKSTPFTLPVDVSIQSAAVGNDRLLLLDSDGRLWVTTNKVDWQVTDLQAANRPSSIVFFRGKFYTCDGNQVWRSVDGLNWSRIDYSTSSNPVVNQQIRRLEVAGPYLVGTPKSGVIYDGPNHIYVSNDGIDFRRIWLEEEMVFDSDVSWYNGLEYFRGRFWGHEFRKVVVSPPVELVADTKMDSGLKKSNWFGIYQDNQHPTVNHISLGIVETGIDLNTGEFFLNSDPYGRFHVLSPFHENALYLYSLDFDKVFFVAKYNDDLTRSAEGDFYDHALKIWTDEINPGASDYETAMAYFGKSVENLRSRRNQTVQYAELKDLTATHQFLSESSLYYQACVRNGQRTRDRLEEANPVNKTELLQQLESGLNEARALMEEAQNAYHSL